MWSRLLWTRQASAVSPSQGSPNNVSILSHLLMSFLCMNYYMKQRMASCPVIINLIGYLWKVPAHSLPLYCKVSCLDHQLSVSVACTQMLLNSGHLYLVWNSQAILQMLSPFSLVLIPSPLTAIWPETKMNIEKLDSSLSIFIPTFLSSLKNLLTRTSFRSYSLLDLCYVY